ncbi:MAG: succinylglutamate desuccinylase/aspartoacylase family protein [Alphaproteobacteria bacterium]
MAERLIASDERLRIEGLTLRRGKRSQTRIRVAEQADGSWVELPVIVLRGSKPGPVFVTSAAVHGDEINGIEIVTRFAGALNLRRLKGTVIVLPVQNPLAVQAQHRYAVSTFLRSPLDQSPADPWAAFPGNPDGNTAARVAHLIYNRFLRHADYLIDIHTPTTGGRYAPFAFLPPPKVGAVSRRCLELAKAFGADFILYTEHGVYVMEESPHVVMARAGKVAFGVEVSEGSHIHPEDTKRAIQGLTNVLIAVGMIPGKVKRLGHRLVIKDQFVIRASRAGLLERHCQLNETVRKGQVLATVRNMFGEVVEEVRSPRAGRVVRVATFPIVSAGERVAQLGVPF